MNDMRTNLAVAQAMFAKLFVPASIITGLGQEQAPMMCVEEHGGKVSFAPLSALFDNVGEAEGFHQFTGEHESDVRAACMITEVWTGSMDKDDPRVASLLARTIKRDELPRDGEAVMFDFIVNPGQQRFVAVCPILRDESGARLTKGRGVVDPTRECPVTLPAAANQQQAEA